MISAGEADAPTEFRHALESIKGRALRPEVRLEEVPAPRRVAPFSVALTGEVAGATSEDPELATGRFIVLYDPAGQEAWHGRFRVVTLVRATLEPEMASDPLLAQVAWTWVTEAMAQAGAASQADGGTVTRVLSQSFGALADRANDVELEIRASWTPATTDLGPHLEAWSTLLCTAAGLPPLPDGVTALRPRRNTVGP
ncbi:DUF3000 domain-containing protein [Oerskovia flava]|uniref:DUF3000 domain-containing protein n=1 Tax=Oerskovia flava TaxID=2986422 RepID=UPI00223EDF5E|nr:DUF3000 domain-containing protein [Oerskovia sp. JB1-3-2]